MSYINTIAKKFMKHLKSLIIDPQKISIWDIRNGK